jgi:hypothetical protein
MGMATIAQRLAELRAEETALSAAILTRISGAKSVSLDGMSASYDNCKELRSERERVRKSIQRLLRGGRGMVIDLSYAANGEQSGGDEDAEDADGEAQ